MAARGNPQLLGKPQRRAGDLTKGVDAECKCNEPMYVRDLRTRRAASFLRCQHLISPARHVPPSACNPGGRRRAYPLRLF